ncbi:MAG: SusC/RagA family TonB-linked outer membrane protein [Bacteroidota bacterium]
MKQTTITQRNAKLILVLCLLICSLRFAHAQNVITGVVSGDGDVLAGAAVKIKGGTKGALTNETGTYSIEAKSADVLVFSYYGYDDLEVLVGEQTKIDVILTQNVSTLEEVVLVGYGTQKKKEVTGAVVNVGEETIAQTATADLGAALQGMVAGVNIQASSGRPGDAANVQIRGLGSINSNALGPLYVVDGIPYEGNPNIAPEQIKSVDILKDGAAASIYGTRASNGVILITTKRGVAGQMKVDFSAYAGVQNITSGTPLMNATQQLYAEEVRLEALGRDPLVFFFNPRALEYDSDFVGDVQNDNAAIQNYNIGISGGLNNLTLNYNANYFDQNGVLINSGFNRLTNRITGEFKKGKFRAFATVGFTEENREQEPWALYEYGIVQVPWQPPLNGLRDVGENSVEIPVRNAIQYSFLSQQLGNIDERKTESSNIAINLQYEIVKGLTFKVNLGRNSWEYRRKFFRPQYLVYNLDGSYNPTASRENALLNEDFIWTKRETFENVLTYAKSFGKHSFNLLGVVSFEQFDYKALGAGVIFSENSSNDLQTLGSGSEGITPYSNDERRTLSGKLVRLQYNFADRYLFSASLRRDGSSKFSEANRYGNFKGFSAGWNISNEAFFKVKQINGLKIRASWAEVGNQNIASYAFTPVIETGINYPFGLNEDLNFGAIQRTYVDDNIKWETTISSNLGIDLSMFESRLNFTADFYINEKRDMLLQERLPASAGVYQPRTSGLYDIKVTNAGNMINRGMEFALNFQEQTNGGLRYKVTATFTKNVNEVTDLNGIERGYANGRPVVSRGENTDYTTYLAEGYEAGAFFLVQHDGVIKTEEELAAYKEIDASAQLGDMRYIDQNGDGVINDNDRVYSGSGQPGFESGLAINLEYKGFDFYIQNYFSYGAEIYNGAKLYAYSAGRHLDMYHMWTPQNPNSDIPTDRQNAFHNNVRARSDFFIEDGTYLRIRNLNVGYTIPGVSGIGLDRIRVYFSALNPFTFTNYEGYDPEVGGDGIFLRGVDRGNYPVARQFILGLQLGF